MDAFLVHNQILPLGESDIAQVAGERLIVRMYSQMIKEPRHLFEGVVTPLVSTLKDLERSFLRPRFSQKIHSELSRIRHLIFELLMALKDSLKLRRVCIDTECEHVVFDLIFFPHLWSNHIFDWLKSICVVLEPFIKR